MPTRIAPLWQLNKYLWMALAFALAYLPASVALGTLRVSVGAAWTIFGLGVFNVALRTFVGYLNSQENTEQNPRLRGQLSVATWVFTIVDVSLVGVAVRVTGGTASEIWLLYFVIVLAESIYATPAQVRIVALLVGATYLFATAAPFTLAHTVTVSSRVFILIVVGAYARRISFVTEARNRELTLLREQVSVNEERARIAREIHDGLGHAMTSVLLRLELSLKLMKKAPEEAETILREEIPALREAWNTGRDMAFHLRPWEMSDTARFVEALRHHVGRFAERTGLVIELETVGVLEDVRPQIAFAVTRIVQEALTNVARHAGAKTVRVTVRRERGVMTATIADDGVGFEAGKIVEGVGLSAMRERATALEGTLTVMSAPGQGTEVTVRIKV